MEISNDVKNEFHYLIVVVNIVMCSKHSRFDLVLRMFKNRKTGCLNLTKAILFLNKLNQIIKIPIDQHINRELESK